jgi:urease accessory protein
MGAAAGPVQSAPAAVGESLRARGEARATIALVGGRSRASRSFETGGLRLRFPGSAEDCEATLINTGGGMAGGDEARIELTLEDGARAIFATQAAEKIYRADGAPSRIDVHINVGAGARLDWLPQETILFDGAAMSRRLEVDVAADASLMLVEMMVFGRIAMGEARIDASVKDRWHVRRDGKLVFVEAFGLEHAGATLDRPAVGRGARAIATILMLAPDASTRIDALRAAIDAAIEAPGEALEGGATTFNGMTLARLLSPSPARLRQAIVDVTTTLRGASPPRAWL